MWREVLFLGLNAAVSAGAPARPFYAMDNGLNQIKSFDDKAAVLKELGYAGIGWRPGHTAEMLKALDKHGLKMVSSYIGLKVDAEKPSDPSSLAEEIELMKPHGTILWIYLTKGKNANDELAIKLVREVSDIAEMANLKIAIYPHAGFYVATAADSLRMAKLVDRPNVGSGFNLCHFLMQNDSTKLEETVRSLKGRLVLVSINGGDDGERMPMNKALQRLDKGSFDNRRLLKVLDEIGYAGPVALQCYQVPGDNRDNLKESMDAWKTLNSETK